METTKIPLSSCIESKHQNRKDLGDVTGLARSIEVNGQITPLIVVADGEAYQLVAGHRRTAAMKSLGLEEADAYVMDGWDDARIAQTLNAENNHRKELTEAERGRGIQTMLSLGVPVSDAAVSADVPEEKAESYVRGTKLVPADAVNLDFDVVALMGEYDDVLNEDNVVAIFSKKNPGTAALSAKRLVHELPQRPPGPSLRSAASRSSKTPTSSRVTTTTATAIVTMPGSLPPSLRTVGARARASTSTATTSPTCISRLPRRSRRARPTRSARRLTRR